MTAREPLEIVELVVPRCGLRFGVAPCAASLADGPRCFNTWGGCLAKAAYDPTGVIRYRFSEGPVSGLVERAGDDDISTDAIAGLVSVSEYPTSINPEGRRKGETALGLSGDVTVTLADVPWTDHQGDLYRDERGPTVGLFWRKFQARVSFLGGCRLVHYIGERGQALADMTAATYVPTEISGPDRAGRVSIRAVSPLQLLNVQDAKFPPDIEAALVYEVSPTSETLTLRTDDPAQLTTSYGNTATLYLRIADEIISYTGLTDLGGGLYRPTGIKRAALGTSASGHAANDAVSRVARYESIMPWDLAYDILANHSPIPAEFCDLAAWETALRQYCWPFDLTGTIEKPMKVFDLMGEIFQSAMFALTWDPRAGQIIALPIGYRATAGEIDELRDVVADTADVAAVRSERLSRIVIYYRRRDPTGDYGLDNTENISVTINADAEDARVGATPAALVIESRWLSRASQARVIAAHLRDRYAEGSVYYTATVRDRSLALGDVVTVVTPAIVDTEGAEVVRRWRVISITPRADGFTSYKLDEDPWSATGRYGRWGPDEAITYESATDEQRARYVFWSDSGGQMSNGDKGYSWA